MAEQDPSGEDPGTPPVGDDVTAPGNPGEVLPPAPEVEGWQYAPVEGERVDVAASSIVAGTPGAARVEVAADGLHAYDSANVETAAILGEGGEFVGGSFRTSDGLPGMVEMGDDVFRGVATPSNGPGIRVTPSSDSGYTRLPGVGPSTSGMQVYGGYKPDLGESIVNANPGNVIMRAFTPALQFASTVYASNDRAYIRKHDATSGTQGTIEVDSIAAFMRYNAGSGTQAGRLRVRGQDAEVAYLGPDNNYVSQIKANADEATLYADMGGVVRYFTVDATGVWVKTNASGSWKWYNLEKTASDSGWVALSAASGFTPVSEGFDVRQLGRMIYFRGAVTGNVTTDWVTIGTIPSEYRPTVRQINAGASSSVTNLMFQTLQSGALQVKGNTAATGISIFVNTIFYPVD